MSKTEDAIKVGRKVWDSALSDDIMDEIAQALIDVASAASATADEQSLTLTLGLSFSDEGSLMCRVRVHADKFISADDDPEIEVDLEDPSRLPN